MNYNQDVFNDVFTLAHEAGHSMHTWHSARHQPYQYYGYTIFVAEVASTFNEELLSHHLLENARDDRQRAYLHQPRDRRHPRHDHPADDVRRVREDHARDGRGGRAADREGVSGRLSQAARSLFRARVRARRRAVARMPAHPALLPGVLRLQVRHRPVAPRSPSASACCSGGKKELDDYLGFLKGGCSKDPLDLLRDAGVDMEQPEPVETALNYFGQLVEELDELL